jgi:hypothetical protein
MTAHCAHPECTQLAYWPAEHCRVHAAEHRRARRRRRLDSQQTYITPAEPEPADTDPEPAA